MEKFKGTYKDGHQIAVWAIGEDNARFHLKDWCRQHGELIKVELIISHPEENDESKDAPIT